MKKTFALILASAAFIVAQAAAEMKPAIMLQQEGSLWTQASSGEMKWAKNIPAGTQLSVSDEEPFAAKRPSGNKTVESDFCRAEYEGKAYTVMADRIAFGTTDDIKVTVQDAVHYASANILDYTSTIVPQKKALIAGAPVQKDGISFVPVIWFDDVNYVKRTGWIRQDKISSGTDDWAAIELLAKARLAKDKKVKNAVIADARTLSISDSIERLITIEEYNILKDFSPDDTAAQDISFTADFGTPGAYIHIYDVPSTQGTVVGRLFHGAEAHCSKKTNGTSTESVNIAGERQTGTSSWYYIEGKVSEDGTVLWPSGWIFGLVAGIEQ